MSYGERDTKDMITAYKIFTGTDEMDRDSMFHRWDTETKGHNWKVIHGSSLWSGSSL